MNIVVDHIYHLAIIQLSNAGWKVHDTPDDAELTHGELTQQRLVIGTEMVKAFDSLGDAIRDFEKATGYDAISDTDQDGCPVFSFCCPEEQIIVSGWGCGKYLYDKWAESPRAVLELLNTKS